MSVILPTYNRAAILPRAIRSVLAQSPDVEDVVVVDDGSTDDTRAVLAREFGARIRYVHRANGGVSAARNTGLRLATGRYVGFLDSDDEWLPGKVAAQVDFLEARPEFGMVLCDVERVTRDGRPIDVLRRRPALPRDGRILADVLRNPTLVPSSALVRREVFDSVGAFDETLPTGEDLDFHLRVAREWSIGVIDRPLVRAMRGDEGLSMLASTYDDHIRVYEAFAARFAADVPADLLDHVLRAAYAKDTRGLLLERRWGEAWALARRARQRMPAAAFLPWIAPLAGPALRAAVVPALSRVRRTLRARPRTP